jgi:hypothetical protein
MNQEASLESVYSKSSSIISQNIDSGIILIPLSSGVVDLEEGFVSLDDMGRVIWNCLDGKRNVHDIVNQLSIDYECAEDEIRRDIVNVIEELRERRLLVTQSGIEASESYESVSCSVVKRDEMSLPGNVFRYLAWTIKDKGLSLRFRVNGHSMAPSLEHGDIITIEPLKYEPEVGTIVAFIDPASGKFMVHRIIRKERDLFLIQGDNNEDADGTISCHHMIGRLCRVERKGRIMNCSQRLKDKVTACMVRHRLLLPYQALCGRYLKGIQKRLFP